MSMLLLLYLYNPTVMLVLSWDLTKHHGLERLCNPGQKQVIPSFFFFPSFLFLLHILSTTVDSPEHGEAPRHSEKEHQSVLNCSHFMMFLFNRYSSWVTSSCTSTSSTSVADQL